MTLPFCPTCDFGKNGFIVGDPLPEACAICPRTQPREVKVEEPEPYVYEEDDEVSDAEAHGYWVCRKCGHWSREDEDYCSPCELNS
jgi:hypothetical protein